MPEINSFIIKVFLVWVVPELRLQVEEGDVSLDKQLSQFDPAAFFLFFPDPKGEMFVHYCFFIWCDYEKIPYSVVRKKTIIPGNEGTPCIKLFR